MSAMLIKVICLHPGVPQSVNGDIVAAEVVLGSMTVVVSVLVVVV